MKKIIFIIISILNIACKPAAQDINKTKLGEEMLNGRIKSFTEKAYDYENSKDSMKLNYKSTYVFNESGLLSRKQGNGQDISYTYNSEQQLHKCIIHDEDGNESGNNEYYYSNGNLVKHILSYPPSTSKSTFYFDYFVTYYTYDNNGKLIEEKRLSRRHKSLIENTEEHIKYQYDTIGDCILQEELSNEDIVTKRIKNKYLNHKLIESFTWEKFEGENLYLKDLYKYNEDSTILSHTNIIYEYNSSDKIADQTVVNYIYKYDNKHQLIEESEISSKKLTNSYSNFDIKGNWQRKTINDEGKIRIILRQFEYFN